MPLQESASNQSAAGQVKGLGWKLLFHSGRRRLDLAFRSGSAFFVRPAMLVCASSYVGLWSRVTIFLELRKIYLSSRHYATWFLF